MLCTDRASSPAAYIAVYATVGSRDEIARLKSVHGLQANSEAYLMLSCIIEAA